MAPKKPEEKKYVECAVLCQRCPGYSLVSIAEEVAQASANSRLNENCRKCGTSLYYAPFMRDPNATDTKLVIMTRERDAAVRELEIAKAKLETFDKVLGKPGDERGFRGPLMMFPPRWW